MHQLGPSEIGGIIFPCLLLVTRVIDRLRPSSKNACGLRGSKGAPSSGLRLLKASVKFAQIIFANLFRKKMRLFLTVGSFAVALFLFAFLGVVKMAFTFGAGAAVADRLLVVNRISVFNTVPLSYEEKIRRIPGIQSITHDNWFPGSYQDGKDFFPEFVIDPEQQRQVFPEFTVPENQWQAFLEDRQGAIAGERIAARLHWKIGDRIPIVESMNGTGSWEFNLVGIYHGRRPQDDTTQFWFRWDYYEEKVPQHMKGQVGWYTLRLEDLHDAVRVSKAIDTEFANSGYETRTQTESAFAAEMVKQFGNIQLLLLSVGIVVFFTLLLVSGNTLAIAVRERIGELGIFKAIGFSDFSILLFVLAESLIISLIGGILGLILAAVAVPVLAKTLGNLLPGLTLSPFILLYGLLVAVGVGIAGGLIPGIIAMRMRVIQALRKV